MTYWSAISRPVDSSQPAAGVTAVAERIERTGRLSTDTGLLPIDCHLVRLVGPAALVAMLIPWKCPLCAQEISSRVAGIASSSRPSSWRQRPSFAPGRPVPEMIP